MRSGAAHCDLELHVEVCEDDGEKEGGEDGGEEEEGEGGEHT